VARRRKINKTAPKPVYTPGPALLACGWDEAAGVDAGLADGRFGR
jgi:hypothetical protein